jgi:thiol-disulfide isomerase/thioredoxin
VFLFIFSCEKKNELTLGEWQGELHLRDSTFMPFNFVVDENKENYLVTVVNGAETIPLKYDPALSNDDFYVFRFDIFDTYLKFQVTNPNEIKGFFVNEQKEENGEIEFKAAKVNEDNKKENDLKSTLFNGKWKVEFNPKSSGAYPAIGEFLTVNDAVIGTFRTETGDYRFLSGYAKNNRIRLSAFDGAHAFYFDATLKEDTLFGDFFSGNHWKTDWYGVRNDSFELSSPYELTQLISDEPIEFSKVNLQEENYEYPNEDLDGKVVIIQILGSWCPNCLDETVFYKELYEKYKDRGLEIIGLGYEKEKNREERLARLTKYKNRMEIEYPLLLAGEASKDLASKDFPMFNSIISFPTSIFINRKGEVVKIHTGFNGPGTGEVYDNYVERTTTMIEHMLEEN